MSDPVRISKPSDFTMETAVVDLGRRNEAGESLVVKIRAVPRSKITALFGGLPSAASADDSEKIAPLADEVRKEREAASLERWRGVMRLACVEPRLLFTDADGDDGVRWDDLDEVTQQAWTQAILEHSGFKLPQEAGALLTFRVVERGGVPVCG